MKKDGSRYRRQRIKRHEMLKSVRDKAGRSEGMSGYALSISVEKLHRD
jgi:hypothetical protein